MESTLDSILDQAEEGYLIPCRRDDNTIDLLARASNGDTLLHVAVGVRDFSAIRRLLEAGLDINAQGDFHETPFFSAASRVDIGLMGFLLQHGADPSVPDHLGTLPSEAFMKRLMRLPEDRLLQLSEWLSADTPNGPQMEQDAEKGETLQPPLAALSATSPVV